MPITSRASTLAEVIECQLDEVRLALRECLTGLTHDQLWTHPVPDRHSIKVITEHVLLALDTYCGELQTGEMALEHEEVFGVYGMTIEEVEDGITNRFTDGEFFERVDRICDASITNIHGVSDEEMLGHRHAAEMSEDIPDKNALEFCLAGLFHANEHLRQIWLIRGALGLTVKDEHQWPSWLYW